MLYCRQVFAYGNLFTVLAVLGREVSQAVFRKCLFKKVILKGCLVADLGKFWYLLVTRCLCVFKVIISKGINGSLMLEYLLKLFLWGCHQLCFNCKMSLVLVSREEVCHSLKTEARVLGIYWCIWFLNCIWRAVRSYNPWWHYWYRA